MLLCDVYFHDVIFVRVHVHIDVYGWILQRHGRNVVIIIMPMDVWPLRAPSLLVDCVSCVGVKHANVLPTR